MTEGFRAHHRSFGHGPRRALAIHCTLAHSGAWRGMAAALQDDLTLLAYDLPGHGQSADWDGQTDLHRLSTQAGLGFLPVDGDAPIDVIGHSFGATVALRLAVEHPRKVRTLTLVEPVFFAAAIKDSPDRAKVHEAEVAPCFDALDRGDAVQAARLFNRFWGDGTAWDDMAATTRDYLRDRIHLVRAQAPGIIEDNAGLLVPGRMAQAAMPTLLVQGGRAADIVDAINASLAARLPDARRATIAGAGHMAPLTHPHEVAMQVRGLLEMA